MVTKLDNVTMLTKPPKLMGGPQGAKLFCDPQLVLYAYTI